MLIETYSDNILKCHYNICKKKIPFIKMFFYLFIAILCLKMSSVYKPLTGLKDLVSMCSFIT